MKAIIRNDGIDLVPETEAEIDDLIKIWRNSPIKFEKSGSILHGDKKTHHSIVNSSFFIKFLRKL